MKHLLFTLWFGLTLYPSNAQNLNRPVPTGLFPYEYNETEGLSGGYILATPTKMFTVSTDPDYISPYPVIFDGSGYVAWYSKPNCNSATDFKYFESIDTYVYTYGLQGQKYALVMDNQFNIVDTLLSFAPRDAHDLQLADNGNWLLTTIYTDTMDLSAYTFNGSQGSTQTIMKGFGYEEIDPTGNLVGWYNSNSNVSPTETYDFWGYNANNFDYCHGNAVEEDTDGNFLLSYRHLNAIHKIDRQTGAIIWRLGGEVSDFTFTNDNGFSGQHDIRRLANGDYSLFDNGNMSGISRSVTYTLDTINWTATKTNEYIHAAGATSTAMGSFHTSADEVEVVGYGRIMRPEPSAIVLDNNHNELAAFYLSDSVASYRFLRFDLSLPTRPEIECSWNGTQWELVAPSGHTVYAWSNGASTNSIELTQTGTYQVWVTQGSGMLGSFPFVVNDITNPCSVGIEEISSEDGAFVLYDLMGHVVEKPNNFSVYLKVFESGKIEKVVYTEE